MFINFFNANNFTDSRRFCEYLSSLKNLDNWDTNYIEFDKYAAKVKSSTAGLYDPEYIRLKYNVCLLESNKIISAKKSNKATNLKGFIARHGEVKGKELYEKFQKSSISGSKDQVDEYERRRRSCWCKEFYESKGYNEKTSIKMAKEFNKFNAGANKHYWLRKGYNAKEVEQILLNVSSKQSYSNILIHCDRLNIEINQYLTSHEKSDYNEYVRQCWLYTNVSLSVYDLENIELRGKEYGFSLDHVYSINAGFLNDVDPKYIGHITNLKVVDELYNSSKGAKCDKSLDELITEYNLHESIFN